MVDAWKILPNVELQKPLPVDEHLLHAQCRRSAPFPFPAGIAVKNGTSLEDWLKDVADRMVKNTVANISSGNDTPFWLKYFKDTVRRRLVFIGTQFIFKPDQFGFKVKKESCGDHPLSAAKRAAGSIVQVVEIDDSLKQIAVSAHYPETFQLVTDPLGFERLLIHEPSIRPASSIDRTP